MGYTNILAETLPVTKRYRLHEKRLAKGIKMLL